MLSRIGSFHVVVLQRTARKRTKISNARAELLLCSLSLLFGDVLVAVAVVVFLSSLKKCMVNVLNQRILLALFLTKTYNFKLHLTHDNAL